MFHFQNITTNFLLASISKYFYFYKISFTDYTLDIKATLSTCVDAVNRILGGHSLALAEKLFLTNMLYFTRQIITKSNSFYN